MCAYILRRVLLMIPTLVGIMVVNFALTQFVPGGPIEQIVAQIEGEGDVLRNITGAGDAGGGTGGVQPSEDRYVGARGLPPEMLDRLEVQMGFARIVCAEGYQGEPSLKSPECRKEAIGAAERFLIMMGNYLRFDFGQSFFRSISVVDLVIEKMPVSITLGLWSTLLAYLISIPLGIRKAVRDGSRFDIATSGVVLVGYAIPGFLFAILLVVLFAGGTFLQIFPLRGLVSSGSETWPFWQRALDYAWHMALPTLALVIGGFAGLTMLTKNSFLDEIGKQYVVTARAKGATERRTLYGHVFRNAMLIIIAGFPSAFISILFTGALLIEIVFSLDGLGLLGFEAAIRRDYPVMFATLYIFTLLGLIMQIVGDFTYTLVDPRIDFEARR